MMKVKSLLLSALLLVFLSACHSYGPRFDARQPETGVLATNEAAGVFQTVSTTNQIQPDWLQPSKDLYRLGPGDVIEVESLGEAGSRSSLVVGPDGKVYYGISPGTFVWGLTLTETRETLLKELQKFLRVAPDLTVTLQSVSSQTVWILGNVQSPGVYPLATPLNLLEAILMAGGALNVTGGQEGICDLRRSFVMRDGSLLPVDFDALLRRGDMSQNIYLRPNDFVYLRSGLTQNVFVLGAVGAPNVVPFSHQLSLMAAIMSAGGTVPYAHTRQVAIIRGSLSRPRIAVVDFKNIIEGHEQESSLGTWRHCVRALRALAQSCHARRKHARSVCADHCGQRRLSRRYAQRGCGWTDVARGSLSFGEIALFQAALGAIELRNARSPSQNLRADGRIR